AARRAAGVALPGPFSTRATTSSRYSLAASFIRLPVPTGRGYALRLRLLELFLRHHPLLVKVHEGAALVADDDVGQAVAIDVAGNDLCSDARSVVDQIGHVVDACTLTHQLEPVEHCG